MSTTLYSPDHEWLKVEGNIATIGITDYAQQQLGDIVYVELPKVGRGFARAEVAAVVESVKAASDIYAPISGDVVEINTALNEQPALINSDAEGQGWLFRFKMTDPRELGALMDAAAYEAHTT
ncbi:MAG: glycine cleavage system protein GcvH [Alphaproteobacteria bacterium]|nr:glycine cleavage system protein GcvH [Alphaproteobacteria bacterium]